MPTNDRYYDYMCNVKPGQIEAGKALLQLAPEDLAQTLRAILVRLQYKRRTKGDGLPFNAATLARLLKGTLAKDDFTENRVLFRTLISDLLRFHLPLTTDDLATLVRMVANKPKGWWQEPISPDAVLHAIERQAAEAEISQTVREELKSWLWILRAKEQLDSADRKLLTRISLLLGQGKGSGIKSGEAWSNAALEDLKRLNPAALAAWSRLLQYCQRADSSKPTQKWNKAANELITAVGREDFKSHIIKWFDLVALPRPIHQEPDHGHSPDPDQLIADANATILKGLAWCCAGWEDTDISRALSRLAQVCFKKVRNLGPRCPRVGNACLFSLSTTKSQDAAAELSRLDQVVKPPSAKKLIGKSLNKAAELTGQTRADLEEASVPNYGLDSSGRLKQQFGDFSAEICITGPQAMEILWRKSDGKAQKSVPAEVKEKHADDFKKFKRTLQDIEKMLPAQRIRIERLLLSERIWNFETWRQRYLDHPLLSTLTRRLIWHFRQGEKSALGIWFDGQIVGIDDKPLALEKSGSPSVTVRLWHPIGTEPETVAAWRRWLESHEIVQPFKQAHREIYILTDAELQTANYSNRFAAHIIRQHQFTALAKERGWNYRLQGAFDSHNVPTLLLGAWDIAAEFWVDSTGGHEDTSQSGIFLYLSTDQVRFTDPVGEPRLLSEVPALVFSEVMRDVDFFVGVCSIGNDPAWQDNGEAEGATTYWRNYSFSDLSASAATRKDVLMRLIPKLRIAPQCSFKDRYLVVRGSFRTYKIHLGSGNILMEPNDRYLCIVPDRGARVAAAADRVFLPFEGDNTLSLILSKAFLLADDAKITDSSILSQIKH